MTTRRVLLLAGLALVAGGLLFGFLPRTVSGENCGSAFVANRNAWVADVGNAVGGRATDIGGRCSDARSSGRVPAFVLLALGGVLAVGSAFVGPEPGTSTVAELGSEQPQ
jgi:hypothetical protein